MKYVVVWSAFSQEKLDEIFEYHKFKVSYKVAKQIITELIKGANILETNPFAGPIELLLANRKEKYYYLVCGNYKVIYSVDSTNKQVKIADVFDTRQNPTIMGK